MRLNRFYPPCQFMAIYVRQFVICYNDIKIMMSDSLNCGDSIVHKHNLKTIILEKISKELSYIEIVVYHEYLFYSYFPPSRIFSYPDSAVLC